MTTQQQFEQKQDDSRKESFRKWMQDPMTRALLSTIPPCENLEVLLLSAHQHGFNAGASATAISFLESMLRGPRQ